MNKIITYYISSTELFFYYQIFLHYTYSDYPTTALKGYVTLNTRSLSLYTEQMYMQIMCHLVYQHRVIKHSYKAILLERALVLKVTTGILVE